MLKISICTLFEGHYHHGVAVLSNSLFKKGFRGDIFVGYRGSLPDWAGKSSDCALGKWGQVRVLNVANHSRLIFVPVTTDSHLTNYKPDFMLDLMDGPASSCDAIYYFDPDIVISASWSFYQEWIDCGVTLCEDVNSPVPEFHPRRVGWRRFYGSRGYDLSFRSANYVNAGLVGVRNSDRAFLERWKLFNQLMAEEIGTLAATKIEGGSSYRSTGFANCFDVADQDALNAVVESYEKPPSIIGQEGMAFKPGPNVALHALGPSKPWRRAYLLEALTGKAPRQVDKMYWQFARGEIKVFGDFHVSRKILAVALSSLLGRFYRRR